MSDPMVEALARRILELERTVSGLSRTRQVAHSTIAGAPVTDVITDAMDTADAVSEHDEALTAIDDDSETALDNWLEEQEESHDADDVAHEGHYVGVEALEFANRLQDELAEANLQLEEALREARESLAESGQARGEAAKAVEDAERAAADAAAAIQRALEATGLANTAQDRADSAFGKAADAQTQAEGADLKAGEAQSTAQNAQSTADSARQTAEQASADVTSKAAAAEAAAKSHADAQSEAARLAAIAAASGDATDKANAARAAAEATAASDASTKAEAARVAAEAKAAEAKSAADAAKSIADAAHSLAGTARDTAQQAQTTASGKNAILRSTAVPSGTGTSAGDKWERYSTLAAGGKLIGTWAWSGSSWVSTVLDESYLPLVNIGQGTYGDLSGARLVAQSVLADAIASNAVTAVKIAANAVTAVKLAANAVTAEKINAGAVATEKLAALAVTAEKLAAGSVVADKIAANAITAAKIAAGAIDGMVITGALMRTAATGQRLQFDVNGLRAFNASGQVVAGLYSSSGGLELDGILGVKNRLNIGNDVDAIRTRMWRSGLEQYYNNSYIATMYGYLHLSNYRRPGNAGIDMTDSSIIHPGKLVATRYLPGVERPNDPWGVAASRQVGLYAETGSVRVQGRANENAEWRTGELWYNNHSDVSELVVDRVRATELQRIGDTEGTMPLGGYVVGSLSVFTAEYSVRAGWVAISLNVTGTIPESAGVDVWFDLPTDLRPPSNRQAAAWMAGGYVGTAWVRANGTIAVANRSGASRSSAQFTIVYPKP